MIFFIKLIEISKLFFIIFGVAVKIILVLALGLYVARVFVKFSNFCMHPNLHKGGKAYLMRFPRGCLQYNKSLHAIQAS